MKYGQAEVIGLGAALLGIGALWWHSRKSSSSRSSDFIGPPASDQSTPIDYASTYSAPLQLNFGGDAMPAPTSFNLLRYAPLAPETIALFTAAAQQAQLPTDWAADVGLHNILQRESGGYVGRPNYQFGAAAALTNASNWWQIWAAIKDGSWRNLLDQSKVKASGPSSATGLGQLTSTNIATGNYYPSGLNGIGNALEEAIGMLRYIKQRYGSPTAAWAQYGVGHEGY